MMQCGTPWGQFVTFCSLMSTHSLTEWNFCSWVIFLGGQFLFQGEWQFPLRWTASLKFHGENCFSKLLQWHQNLIRFFCYISSLQCLMHLEDRLQEIYFNSTVLASYLETHPGATTKELSLNLGFSVSDFQLLLSVTSVHSPHVIMSVLKESYEKLRSSPERTPPSSLKEAQWPFFLPPSSSLSWEAVRETIK